jgi:hypothetical protein
MGNECFVLPGSANHLDGHSKYERQEANKYGQPPSLA